MKKLLCLYHIQDSDGWCSGAIVNKAFYKSYMELQFHGINYGYKMPWEKIDKDTKVVIVDYTPSAADMRTLTEVAGEVIWIDHHKVINLPEYAEFSNLPGIRVIGSAGCELAWEYFMYTKEPLIVHLLGRYDVWQHTPEVLHFQYGLLSYIDLEKLNDPTTKLWSNLLDNSSGAQKAIAKIMAEGEHIYRVYKFLNNENSDQLAFTVDFLGYKAVCINLARTNSLVFDSVLEGHDITIGFHRTKYGQWKFSLTNAHNTTIDVSEIAIKFGGGGHAGAGGFHYHPGQELDPELMTAINNVLFPVPKGD